jgi:hypothetical protein
MCSSSRNIALELWQFQLWTLDVVHDDQLHLHQHSRKHVCVQFCQWLRHQHAVDACAAFTRQSVGIQTAFCARECVHLLQRPPFWLTPGSRVLPEKLTCLKLLKNFPTFYGTRRFITVFTSGCHLSLSWAKSIQSMSPPPASRRFILILSSHLRQSLSGGLLP